MIRIQINNIQQCRQDYINAITSLVAFRVSILQQSLSHLNGVVVNFATGDFRSFKPVTKEIIESVGNNINMPNGRNGYINSINNYLANVNGLGKINVTGLLQVCQYLLANNNQQLSNLLACDASNLMTLNTNILANHGVNTPENIAIVKLAFDYQKYDSTISIFIRDYYRVNKFVNFCPYCNKKEAYHKVNDNGEVVESYELDHFYDKATYPLLSYCLHNLVPSDNTCNKTNKHDTEFSDEYHSNPHQEGYTDRIKFLPIGLNTAYEVEKIEVEITEQQGSVYYKKINGNNQPKVEQGERGNLNVFKIRFKYKDETHRASHLLKTIHKENKNYKHVKKYLKVLNPLERKINYMKWYEREFNVRFNGTDFNDRAFSKFYRDIHDYYFTRNKTRWNGYILELIDNL